MADSQLRLIPSVSELLDHVTGKTWSQGYSRDLITRAIREVLAELRAALKSLPENAAAPPATPLLEERVQERLAAWHSYTLRRVINASGIIVHTNLGRAPLAGEALRHLADVAGGYSNLEFDLDRGERGSRDKHLDSLLCRMLPVEAALVVNNNAAALMLILNTLAERKEVVVSRGELIEIGGSFRLPDIMQKSGAQLREVGTTNKTRIEDYRQAINEQTGMILSVHPSNYRIVGFTEKPSLRELAELTRERGVPLVKDQGSGVLLDLAPHGIRDEAAAQVEVAEGADIVCFSGDKMLGGPQAGIVAGSKDLVERMRKNPLFRALRVDKIVYSALEATLMLYLRGRSREIPVIEMLSRTADELKRQGRNWLSKLKREIPDAVVGLVETTAFVGGGAAPMKGLASFAIVLTHPQLPAQEIARRLRAADPAIVSRLEEDRVLFDLRTLRTGEMDTITAVLRKVCR